MPPKTEAAGNGVMMVDPKKVPEAPLEICQPHLEEIMERLTKFGAGNAVAKTDEEAKLRLSLKKGEPVQDVAKVLFALSINAMGTDAVARFRCPVCAFKKFDFITEIAEVVAPKYQEPSRIITFVEPKLVIPGRKQ